MSYNIIKEFKNKFFINKKKIKISISNQILGNVKFKIEACSKTYNNFSLLYLKAKIFLVKRLIQSRSKSPNNQNTDINKGQDPLNLANSNQIVNHTPASQNQAPKMKKKFSMDKLLSIFFKPLIEINNTPAPSQDNKNDYIYVAPVMQDQRSSKYSNGYYNSRSDFEPNDYKIM